jgi:hypothetical protein
MQVNLPGHKVVRSAEGPSQVDVLDENGVTVAKWTWNTVGSSSGTFFTRDGWTDEMVNDAVFKAVKSGVLS